MQGTRLHAAPRSRRNPMLTDEQANKLRAMLARGLFFPEAAAHARLILAIHERRTKQG